jgi:hypothetical protein
MKPKTCSPRSLLEIIRLGQQHAGNDVRGPFLQKKEKEITNDSWRRECECSFPTRRLKSFFLLKKTDISL